MTIKTLFVCICFLSLTGCGGGGGGGVVESTNSFPLKAALSTYVTTASTDIYTITGQGLNSDGTTYTISGNAQIAKTASIVGPFEGVNYLKTSEGLTGTLIFNNIKTNGALVNSIELPYSGQGFSYYDADFNPMGGSTSTTVGSETSTSYEVNKLVNRIPNFGKVGDSGTLYTTTEYSSSSKSSVKSTSTTTFEIKPETSSTAIIVLSTQESDSDGTTSTNVRSYRMDLSGSITPISQVNTFSNGVTIKLSK